MMVCFFLGDNEDRFAGSLPGDENFDRLDLEYAGPKGLDPDCSGESRRESHIVIGIPEEL
jgi:hypothetical protein